MVEENDEAKAIYTEMMKMFDYDSEQSDDDYDEHESDESSGKQAAKQTISE